MTFWQLAALHPPVNVHIEWETRDGATFVQAGEVRAYLAELLAVPHSAFWDFLEEQANAVRAQ